MEAEKIVLPNGSSASLAASHTLTDTKDAQVKMVPVPAPATNVIVFLIGGAGDKKRFLGGGPYHNIQFLEDDLNSFAVSALSQAEQANFKIEYRGYYEAYGDERIKEYFLDYIQSKRTLIYLIGHSLGGWNGAHLSNKLSNLGYKVRMLITLDPVGESTVLEFSSKIYSSQPTPKAERWINIYAAPTSSNFTDFVAWMGEKWEITAGPNINTSIDTNHAEAQTMFRRKLDCGSSALDLIGRDIKEALSK